MSVEAAGAGRRPTARRRVSAAFWRRPWLRATHCSGPPLVVLPDLCRRARRFCCPRSGRRPVHGRDRPHLEPRQLPASCARADLLADHAPDDRYRSSRHRHGRPAGLPVRVLHGPDRRPADEDAALRARADAAVVELSRAHLFLALDPFPGRRAELVARPSRAPDQHIAYTNWAVWIVFSYIWLPFMILPVYAALERIPDSFIEASAISVPGTGRRSSGVVLPLALPGSGRGLDLHVLADARRLHRAHPGRKHAEFIGNVVYEHARRRRTTSRSRRRSRCSARCDGALPRARRAARARSRRSDGEPGRTGRARRLDGARRPLPLDAARDHPRLRVQPVEHPELADPGLHAAVVPCRLARPGRARRTVPVAEGGADRDGRRARARDDGGVGGLALPLLRPRGALVPPSCSRSRCPGSSRGSRSLLLHVLGRAVLALDDRHRPRDLLRRDRLQQRARPAAAHLALARRGLDGPRRRRLADLPLRHVSRFSRLR